MDLQHHLYLYDYKHVHMPILILQSPILLMVNSDLENCIMGQKKRECICTTVRKMEILYFPAKKRGMPWLLILLVTRCKLYFTQLDITIDFFNSIIAMDYISETNLTFLKIFVNQFKLSFMNWSRLILFNENTMQGTMIEISQ